MIFRLCAFSLAFADASVNAFLGGKRFIAFLVQFALVRFVKGRKGVRLVAFLIALVVVFLWGGAWLHFLLDLHWFSLGQAHIFSKKSKKINRDLRKTSKNHKSNGILN